MVGVYLFRQSVGRFQLLRPRDVLRNQSICICFIRPQVTGLQPEVLNRRSVYVGSTGRKVGCPLAPAVQAEISMSVKFDDQSTMPNNNNAVTIWHTREPDV